jgi:hypothetical protein
VESGWRVSAFFAEDDGVALDHRGREEMQEERLRAVAELLWGTGLESGDIGRWYAQGFAFATPFGLRQLSGGPCGILAAVNGFLLCRLLFSDDLLALAAAAARRP